MSYQGRSANEAPRWYAEIGGTPAKVYRKSPVTYPMG